VSEDHRALIPTLLKQKIKKTNTKMQTQAENTTIQQIPVTPILPNPHNRRVAATDPDVAELAASIRAKGVVQPMERATSCTTINRSCSPSSTAALRLTIDAVMQEVANSLDRT
jgi:hypothetical protein